MIIFCCNCDQDVEARLTDGGEVYPHRSDLADVPFWKCDMCGGHVGCHYKRKKSTKPLGVIPSPQIKNARIHIHKLIDPPWQNGLISRKQIYEHLSKQLGYPYHTAELRTLEDARDVYRLARDYFRNATKATHGTYKTEE